MTVIIQTPITVMSKCKHRVYDHIKDEELYNTEIFDLSHEYNNGGIFTVTLVPINQGHRLEQYALRFTVDYNTLNEIYKEPGKFITAAMTQYEPDIDDMCAQINDHNEVINDGFFFDPSYVTKLPRGFTVVTYTEPDGSKEVIAYCDERNHIYTDEEKKTLDEVLGAGCYKLLDYKAAKRYIKNKDTELEKENKNASKSEEACYDHHSSESEGFMNEFLNSLFGKPGVEEF